jgi:hypothetical protein
MREILDEKIYVYFKFYRCIIIFVHGRTFIEKIVGKYSGDKLLNVRVQTDSQLSR